ncbi:nicotinamide riboside transporter PnuC [Ferrimonas marina]|uniref:Nicotinamide riboside transporter PnuC n=1 Tax=Ferrimonas marina TaxID=299255 RepID=A0A1M5Z4R0_9GAMM|nr:nicotinamide riboside transporter PnuC [Ferrimonas marina]SHI19190.1 nicotinamide mononucleotide transporter [Ferrimonas marina]
MTTVSELLQGLWAETHALTGWEALAVVLAIAYLLLAMRQNQWCWAAAAVSTIIYTALFWQVALLMESALNLFYLVMAGVGFWQWRYGGGQGQGVAMVSWSWQRHLGLIAVTALVALGLGYLMDTRTHAELAYLDAMTTCFAVVTTYLLVKKVLENWIYWVVIDLASIYLYLQKGFMLSSGLYLLYVGMATVAYLRWRQEYRQSASYAEVRLAGS